jgi:hypothetical protein
MNDVSPSIEDQSSAAKSFDKWRELDQAIDQLLRDALYVAGHQHVLSHYGSIPEGDCALIVSKDALKEEAQGLLELLGDMKDDMLTVRKQLKAYLRVNK